MRKMCWLCAASSLQLGYYSVAPIRDYWSPIDGPESPNYSAWQREKNTVAPIAQQASAHFPSAYTFYTDQAGWQKYAIAQVAEARSIAPGKPVHLFLWPQYDDAKGAQGGDSLPDAYWQMELETAKQYADGVVIWGGWQQTWDSNASWWLETQRFIAETGANQVSGTGKRAIVVIGWLVLRWRSGRRGATRPTANNQIHMASPMRVDPKGLMERNRS